MVTPRRALADTSVFIGLEAARFDAGRFAGYEWGVSAVTLGELRLGVLVVTQDSDYDAMPDVQVIKI